MSFDPPYRKFNENTDYCEICGEEMSCFSSNVIGETPYCDKHYEEVLSEIEDQENEDLRAELEDLLAMSQPELFINQIAEIRKTLTSRGIDYESNIQEVIHV